MKIFIICGKHPLKSSGGYATYTHALCKLLKNMGYDVNIIAISDKNGMEESDIGRIYTVTDSRLPVKSSTFITGLFPFWSRIIKKRVRDLVGNEHNKCIIYGIGIWGYAAKDIRKYFNDLVRLVNVFFTSSSHETYWLMKGASMKDYGLLLRLKYTLIYLYTKIVLERYEKLSLRKSDLVIVHYDYAKKTLIDQYEIDESKIFKIPYYIEIYPKNSLYTKYDTKVNDILIDNDKFLCVSICRQESRKGINYFLHALQLLKKKNVPIRAIIVGGGDLLNKNMRIAKKLHIDDMVKFTGFLPEITAILSKADVFVQPSLQEGSGSISVFEALKYGVPVITTICDGLPEDIHDKVNGILVPRMNAHALVSAIIDIYNDKELCQQIVTNGKKSVEEKMDSKEMMKGLKRVHQKLWKEWE